MNLLIIMSDEHRRDTMGCMGHPMVQTPNLDALAGRGTVFDNAYTPCPMCVPARASIATGQYVHATGNWDSASPYSGAHKSWMHSLRESGMDVTSIGKLHFRDTLDDTGFSQEILPMHVLNGVGWTVGLLRENLPDYKSAGELAADVGVGESSYSNYDLAIATATENYFRELSEKQQSTDKAAPWAAFVSFVSPHYPLTAPGKYYDLYKDQPIDWPIGHGSNTIPAHEELKNFRRFFN